MQQQEGIENQKLNKLYPTSDGLADAKTTSRDANLVMGLFSPFKYSIPEYEGYDITRFRNNIRFLLIMEDRDNGAGGSVCPLMFDGETSTFAELPPPDNKNEVEKALRYVEQVLRRKGTPVLMMAGDTFTKKHLHSSSFRAIFASFMNIFKKQQHQWQTL